MTFEEQRIRQLVSRYWPNHQLGKYWALKGGISAKTTAFTLSDNQTYILREYEWAKNKKQNTLVDKEYRLLEALNKTTVSVPKPLFKDTSGTLFKHPILLLEFVVGEPIFFSADESLLKKMAFQLASIHDVYLDEAVLNLLPYAPSYLNYAEPKHPLKEELRSKLQDYPQPVDNPVRLLHGDFWPGNILWSNNEIAAVIDWEDAMLGYPLLDVSRTRLELFWFFGEAATQFFTDVYSAQTGLPMSDLVYYDGLAALRHLGRLGEWGLEPSERARMEAQLEQFAKQAMRQL